MRLVVTTLLSIVFVLTFLAFFLLSSMLDYVDSPSSLVESAREVELRSSLVELTTDHIAQEIASDPTLVPMSKDALRSMVATVISETWVEESLRSTHAAVRQAVHGVEGDSTLNLRATKASLRAAIVDLQKSAEGNCQRFLGAEACADAEEARFMIAAIKTRAFVAISTMPDQVDLVRELSGRDRKTLSQVHKGLEELATVRLICLVVLVVLGGIILAINGKPIERMLQVGGALALASGLVYVLIIAVSESMAGERIESEAARQGDGPLNELTVRLAEQMVSDSVAGSTVPAVAIAVAGFLVLIVGIGLGRRKA